MESRVDMGTPQDKLNQIEAPQGDILGEASVTVDVPVTTAFAFWRHLENLPRFMQHVNEVREVGPNRYMWTVDGPVGTSVSWDAKTTRIVENESISWESVQDSEVVNSGSVYFTPTATGATQIRVKMAYTPPAGKLGHAIASLFGKNPEQQISEDLKALKDILAQAPSS